MTDPTPEHNEHNERYGPSEPAGHLESDPGTATTSERTIEVTRAMQSSVANVRSVDIATRPGLWIAAGIVTVLVGLWLGLTDRDLLTAVGLALVAGALVVVMGFRNCHRVARRVFPRGDRMTVRLDASGLTMTVRKGSYHADWSQFHAAQMLREHLILRMRGSAAAIVLPPEFLTAQSQHIALDGIASKAT